MDGLFLLKYILLPEGLMCKIDFNRRIFCTTIIEKLSEICEIPAYFGLPSAPRIFTKLMKILISLVTKLCSKIIIYVVNILLMGVTLKELSVVQDTLIYLLQSLGFLVSIQKSVLNPTLTLEFLGVVVISQDMTLDKENTATTWHLG